MNSKAFDKFSEKLEKIMLPISSKLGTQRHIISIRDGMAVLIPLTIVGGFSILLAQPPVDPSTMTNSNIFYSFLLAWYHWAQTYGSILMIPFNLTIGLLSVYVVVSIANRLSEKYKLPKLETSFISLLTFLCVAGIPETLENGTYLPATNLGASGMFVAMIVALVVVEITHFCFQKNLTIKLPESVPPNVSSPFKILIPMVLNIILFILINTLCQSLTGGGLCDLIMSLLTPILSATESLPSILFLLLLSNFFWFFGIHGDNMISGVVTPITTMNVSLNLEAYTKGEEMTHIFAGQFNGIWGTWTVYIALLISLWIVARSQQLKSLRKLAPVATAFNINEPQIFGIPIVLNVYLLIPMMIALTINICTVYALTYFGVIGKIFMVLPWTTPAPIAAVLSTMDIKVLFLWIILTIVDVIIICPFTKSYDNTLVEQENTQN